MTAPALAVGERLGLGRFLLLEKVGEGGMGLVYRAEDAQLGVEVALKLLIPRYVGRPEREQRLLDEAEYLRRLRGTPGIVQFLDAGRLTDLASWPWLATEFLHGRSVSWLLVSKKLPADAVLWIARQTAQSLLKCHEAGVLHRDTTPANVFVVDEERYDVKLFDFSHAARLGGPRLEVGHRSRLTGTHDVMGTGGYMAPEQVWQAPPSPEQDVYGFGSLLYEIGTRSEPYKGYSRSQYIAAQREDALQPLQLHAASHDLPEDYAELVRACTQRDPRKRPTMPEVLERLLAMGARPVIADVSTTSTATPPVDVTEVLDPPVRAPKDVLGAWAPRIAASAPAQLKSSADLLRSPEPTPATAQPQAAPAEPELAFARPPELRDTVPVPPAPDPTPSELSSDHELDAPPEPEDAHDDELDDEPDDKPDLLTEKVESIVQAATARAHASARGEDPFAKRPVPWKAIVLLALLLAGGTAVALWVAELLNPPASAQNPSVPVETDPETDSGDATPPDLGASPAPARLPTPDTGEDDAAPTPQAPSSEPKPSPPIQAAPQPKPKPKPGPGPESSPEPKPKPQPKPQPAGPDCKAIQADLQAARTARKWKRVLKLAETPGCVSKRERLRLQVEAYWRLGQFERCAAAGQDSDDPKTKKTAELCKTSQDPSK